MFTKEIGKNHSENSCIAKQEEIIKAVAGLKESLEACNWEKVSVGCTAAIDYDEQFDLYYRKRKIDEMIPKINEFKKNSLKGVSEKYDNLGKKSMVSNPALKGTKEVYLTPYDDTPIPSPDGWSGYVGRKDGSLDSIPLPLLGGAEGCYRVFPSAPAVYPSSSSPSSTCNGRMDGMLDSLYSSGGMDGCSSVDSPYPIGIDPFHSDVKDGGSSVPPYNNNVTPLDIPSSPCTDSSPAYSPGDVDSCRVSTPLRRSFDSLPSLAALRSNSSSLVLACSYQFYHDYSDADGHCVTLSWTFSVVNPLDKMLYEFVFLPKSPDSSLSLEIAVGSILDHLNYYKPLWIQTVRRFKSLGPVCPASGSRPELVYESSDEADRHACALYPDGKSHKTTYIWPSDPPHITLLVHGGRSAISSFDQSSKKCVDILHRCSEVHDGLVSFGSCSIIHFHPHSLRPEYNRHRNTYRYNLDLSISDSLCHTVDNKNKISEISDCLGISNMVHTDLVPNNNYSCFIKDPCSFIERSALAATAPLLYIGRLYGLNCKVPITFTRATSAVVKKKISNYFSCASENEYNENYRGMCSVKKGKHKSKGSGGYYYNTSKLEPISNDSKIITQYFSDAYHGGLNACIEVGYFPFPTYDMDLKNAYPLALSVCPDVDWRHPIKQIIHDRQLTLDDFRNEDGQLDPLTLFVGSIRFEFPKDAAFTSIPIAVEDVPVFPRTSDGARCVYACGPEVFLALQLHASVYCKTGYIANPLKRSGTGEISHSLGYALKELIVDRAAAKQMFGKGSLPDLTLKNAANGTYGKISQSIIAKAEYDSRTGTYTYRPCSDITNPVLACLTTSLVRAVIIAALVEAQKASYHVYSVTTDGFITDMPIDELRKLDLYGFRPILEKARLFLTDGECAEIWEQKHVQNDLVNFTTRGNVSLSSGGVCAHSTMKSGFEPDSYNDRLFLMKSVITRTESISYDIPGFTSYKNLLKGEPFAFHKMQKSSSLNFDMKRKPIEESLEARFVPLEGKFYEMATFATRPYENINEYQLYRKKAEKIGALRTVAEWKAFFRKPKEGNSSVKIRDHEWAVLNSCIMLHRKGAVKITPLDTLKGADRNAYINKHNRSAHLFCDLDWKNAGRKERWNSILDTDEVKEKLRELQEDDG